MSVISSHIQIKDTLFHVLKTGIGDNLLIAFHGYGDNARLFLPLMQEWSDNYVLYSVDLPLHGDTKGSDIDEEVFLTLLFKILEIEKKEQCTLLGLSFGGRIVFRLFMAAPTRVKELVLLAPEGLVTRKLYQFVLSVPNGIKRKIFGVFINAYAVRVAEFLYRMRCVSRYLYRFLELNADTALKRERMLIYWLAESGLSLNWSSIVTQIERFQIPIRVFLGDKDEVIPVSIVEKMARKTGVIELTVLNANHRKVFREFMKVIKNE